MILCLACGRVSPGDSLYCSHCARSLGARVCANKHADNRLSARCCATCGSPLTAPAAACLRLGWLTTLVTFLVALLILRLLITNAGTVLCLTTSAGVELAAFLFAVPSGCVWMRLREFAYVLFLLWLFGQWMLLLPGKGGGLGVFCREQPVKVARLVGRWSLDFLRWLWVGFWRLLFGVRAKNPGKDKAG